MLNRFKERAKIAYNQVKEVWSGWIKSFSIQARYRIEKIDVKKRKVIVRFRYSRSYIKINLEDVMNRPAIIGYLFPQEACWLGYYYSTILEKQSSSMVLKEQPKIKLGMKTGHFKIISLDESSSILTYVDTLTNQVYKEAVLDVAKNELIIKNIDPTQACYIGMRAGIQVVRHGAQAISPKINRPALRIIK